MSKLMNVFFVVSPSEMSVLDAFDSEVSLKRTAAKRAEKGKPFPTDSIALKVAQVSLLPTLKTDELVGGQIIEEALVAAEVSGVPFSEAVQRLVSKGIFEVVPFDVCNKNNKTD